MSVFSERLSFLRGQKHISQQALSQRLGISNRAYQYYESGEREPTISVAARIASFYGVSLDYLTGGAEAAQPFRQIHHVAMIVSDYEKAKEFYVAKLGFPVLRENFREDRGDWKLDLQFGDSELEIFAIPDAPPRPSYPEAQGLRHLAFRVDDVEVAVKELEAKGIPCEPIRWDPYTQRRMTFFHDPDGLPLELHE